MNASEQMHSCNSFEISELTITQEKRQWLPSLGGSILNWIESIMANVGIGSYEDNPG
jgi:hypothetical protein